MKNFPFRQLHFGEDSFIEISYYIHLRNENKSEDFVRELQGIENINFVNLFLDEEKFSARFVNRINNREEI